jgi:hypothetical protein
VRDSEGDRRDFHLGGLACGSNRESEGSAGPTVISRRPRVRVSFNSPTQPGWTINKQDN